MDPQRMTVDRGVLHHAVTPLWSNKSKKELAQWFSDNGFARAYGSNPANWSGLINPFTGGRSYSQTHAVGQRVDSTTPDATAAERAAGYRVFAVVKDVAKVITWHAGDWTMNRRSVAVENLGDYRLYALRDGDVRVLADFFRPFDKSVNGNLYLLLHNEVIGTICPARIAESRGKIVEYINKPPVSITSKTDTYNPAKKFKVVTKTTLVNIPAGTKYSDTTYSVGHEVTDVVERITYSDGKVFYRTKYARDTAKKMYGFVGQHLSEVKSPVITIKEEVRDRVIKAVTERLEDSSMAIGEEKVMSEGADEIVRSTYLITYTDGIKTNEELVKSVVVQEMIVRVILYGTKPDAIHPAEPTKGEDAKSWVTRLFKWALEILSKFTFKG